MGILGVRFFFFLEYFELDEQITLLKAAVFLYTKPNILIILLGPTTLNYELCASRRVKAEFHSYLLRLVEKGL